MPQIPFPGMIGPSYVAFSRKAECERSRNCYRVRVESDEGVNPFVLYKSPGLLPYIEFSAGVVRGCMSRDAETKFHAFVCVGGTIYDIQNTSIDVTYSSVANDGLPVQMAASPTTLMIASAGNLYRINAGALVQIVPGTGLGVRSVAFIKNYFVVLYDDLQQIGWSENDGATFPAGNVQTFEADANRGTRLEVIHQQLFVIGTRITQVFSVGTDPDAPFDPHDGAVIRSGTRAFGSVQALGNDLIWLESRTDGQGRVVRISGYDSVPISNRFVENQIREIEKEFGIDDAIGIAYQLNGQEFYMLTFPAADVTLELNASIPGDWCERFWWQWPQGVEHRHRANCVMSSFGRILVGDHENGFLYEMSPDIYHDYGFPLLWERIAPHIIEGNKPIGYDRLDIGCETGVGLENPLWLNNYSLDGAAFATALATAVSGGTVTADQATVLTRIYNVQPYTPLEVTPTPQVMHNLGFYPWGASRVLDDGITVIGGPPTISMSYSNDGAKSFGQELARNLGEFGDDREVYWTRCGQTIDRVFRLSGESPVKYALTTCYIDVTGATEG